MYMLCTYVFMYVHMWLGCFGSFTCICSTYKLVNLSYSAASKLNRISALIIGLLRRVVQQ